MATAPRDLLAAARRGDEAAYRSLVEPHRGELHAHCYRMLGSVHDAEDALHDVMLRAWRGLPRFEGRSSVRAWLYRIATNTCLNALGRRPRRTLPLEHAPAADPAAGFGEPVTETVWLEPYPDAEVEDGRAAPAARYERRESLELAFIAALQHLPARGRAALLMRDVLGFSAREAADALGTTVPAVNSALQRARRTLDERLPDRSQQATLRALGDERLRGIVDGYMAAMERGDVDAVVALLAEDATWSMPPQPEWYRGHEAIVDFLRRSPLSGAYRWRHVPARANGQAAVGCYVWDPDRRLYAPGVVDVLTLDGDRSAAVTAFLGAEVPPRLGLPESLPA
jgi:RNA polymerase sigma-70 factor, ECF subfamily